MVVSSLNISVNGDVVGSIYLQNSLHWKSRSNVEWSISVETEFLIESSCVSFSLCVEIENLPFLVGSIVFTPGKNSLTFNIFSSTDIKSFSVLKIDEVFTFIFEDLPPFRVGAVDSHFLGSTVGLDVP